MNDKKSRAMTELVFEPQDIPEYALKIVAMAALELTESILRQPGGREMLNAETARRHLRQREEAKKSAPK